MTITQEYQCKYCFIKDRVSCGLAHIVAVLEDGSVVAYGNNDGQQCEVSTWKNVAKVQCGPTRTVALKTDGTVVSTLGGHYNDGITPGEGVEEFSDIVDIAVGLFHNISLRKDGTVVACGSNEFGQCDVNQCKTNFCRKQPHYRTLS